MRILRRAVIGCLLVCLTAGSALDRARADEGKLAQYRQRLLEYYCYYQSDAAREMEDCLTGMEEEDRAQGALWRKIMADWDRLNTADYASRRVLPDSLPGDDSLCIVVFGYGLASDGSMLPELEDRLYVALNAARQYPQAYLAVTGGETSDVPGISEAGRMADWLRKNGVADSRLIVENEALSTTQNAVRTYGILTRSYPQVHTLAAVSSDYHVTFAAVMLQILSDYNAVQNGGPALNVAAGISCATDTPVGDNMLTSQAWGIGILTDTQWTGNCPQLYSQEQTLPPETGELPEVTLAQEPEVPEEKGIAGRFLDWLLKRS